MSHFPEALQLVLKFEGGYYAGGEARDPNPTNFGVTQNTYDVYRDRKKLARRGVLLIEEHEVEAIYRGYWEVAACDKMPKLTALAVFDMAINAGPRTGIQMLQRALGKIEDDGRWGPQTLLALDEWQLSYHVGDVELAERVCWERVRHYVNLAKSERLRPNLLSWIHRVVKFREEYLK